MQALENRLQSLEHRKHKRIFCSELPPDPGLSVRTVGRQSNYRLGNCLGGGKVLFESGPARISHNRQSR